jgi:acyl carrier protein
MIIWRTIAKRNVGEFFEVSRRILKRFDRFNEKEFGMDVEMDKFGIDSLDAVEFVIALEQEMKVELTDEEALAINSVQMALNTFQKYKKIE